MAKVAPTSNGVSPFALKAASFFLFSGLLFFPFAIAVSNFFFALLMIVAFIQPNIFQKGWHLCWHKYRNITLAVLIYFLLTIIGTLWSTDHTEAFRLITKGIYWLLVPIIIGITAYLGHQTLTKAYIAVSIGLFLHLIVCTLQYFSLFTLQQNTIGGTSALDPTGFLGHLSFGFIYGIWIGALLIQASITTNKWKYLFYALSGYAFISTFLTQGRSGYLITLAIVALVFWKKYLEKISFKHMMVLLSIVTTTFTLFLTLNQAGKNKLHKTVNEIQSFYHGDFKEANIRLKIWRVTLDIWQGSPWLGIGTGSFRQAFENKVKSPQYAKYHMQSQTYDHAHNEFLFDLVRWGPMGLLIYFYLIFSWIKTGIQGQWKERPMSAYLITGSGLAVLINSFSDSTMTALTTIIFAIIALAFGMSQADHKQST